MSGRRCLKKWRFQNSTDGYNRTRGMCHRLQDWFSYLDHRTLQGRLRQNRLVHSQTTTLSSI